MSWFGGSKRMGTITCTLNPFSLGTQSDLKAPTTSTFSRLQRYSETEEFPRQEARRRHIYWAPVMFQVLASQEPQRKWLLSLHFTDEEIEVRDEGGNSWQSWELSIEHSDYRALFTETCCFSAQRGEHLSVFLLLSHVPLDPLTKPYTLEGNSQVSAD